MPARGTGVTPEVVENNQLPQTSTTQTQVAATTIVWDDGSDSDTSTNLSDTEISENTGEDAVVEGNKAGVDTDVSESVGELLNVSSGVQDYLDSLDTKIDAEQNKKKSAQLLMYGLALLGGEGFKGAAELAQNTIFFDDTQLNSLLDSKDEIIDRAEQKYLTDQGLIPPPGSTGSGGTSAVATYGGKRTATLEKEVRDLIKSRERRLTTNNKIDSIISRVEEAGGAEGYRGTATEFFKNVFGGQDEVSLWKKNFTNLINTEVVNNLPPGVASDRDIALIKSGFPEEHWDKKTIVRWMQAYRKVNKYLSDRESYRAGYIEETGRQTGWETGFNEQWESGGATSSSSSGSSTTTTSGDDSDVDLDLSNL